MKKLRKSPYFVFIIAAALLTFASAKWTVSLAPWLGYAVLLYGFRLLPLWRGLSLVCLSVMLSTAIGAYEVVPAPLPIFIVISVLSGLKVSLPFLIDRLVGTIRWGWMGTLLFPGCFVVLEYLDSFGGAGTWGSVAHTQYQFLTFQQIAAVLGTWGVSFFVYWFASLVNFFIEQKKLGQSIKKPVVMAGTVYLTVFAFGFLRLMGGVEQPTVDIAAITMDNGNMLVTAYEDAFGETMALPADVAQSSPQVQELYRALPLFIANPTKDQFAATRSVIDQNLDSLFSRSMKAAAAGAKIVVWSEAIGVILDTEEQELMRRARAFAQDEMIYLVMGLGVIHPGPMNGNRRYMTNKTVTVSPTGDVLNTYLKSNPVPFAEQDYGSDGIIPILSTEYGNLSPIICYDADFQGFMRQTGTKQTDILLVPSGDWQAIAPFHSYMAALRGIENGCSMVRPANRGTLMATDPYGSVLAKKYFFDPDGQVMMAAVPTKGMETIYNRIGDVIVYFCIMICGAFTLLRMANVLVTGEKE